MNDESITIDDILASLNRRGFYRGANSAAVRVQMFAVQEELGEIARTLRRDAQGVRGIDPLALATEAADVVIAAVCLLGAAAGDASARILAGKLAADEARGWLHNGGDDAPAGPIPSVEVG